MKKKGEKNKFENKIVKNKKVFFTRKFGIYVMGVGLAFQLLNILTYGLWKIDIDILGVLIFIIGLIIAIVKWKK